MSLPHPLDGSRISLVQDFERHPQAASDNLAGCAGKLGLAAGLVVLAGGCALDPEPAGEDETGSTHAVISISRSETADGENSRAEALAGFLNVPPLVDAAAAMQLVGLGLDLPDLGSCLVGESNPVGPLTETALVEFVEAGDVTLDVAGAREQLAPFAFPTVTDSISGVLYTSRDRAADPLPSDSRYTVSADGLGLVVARDAPKALEGVTLSGLPLAEVEAVKTGTPLDLTWSVASAGDVVYVELSGGATGSRTICSFADDVGAGSVPTDGFTSGSIGQVAVHRLRMHSFEVLEADSNRGQLRFDFALTANIAFE